LDAFFTSARGLSWNADAGVGFLPVTAFPYDAGYFAKYAGYEGTPLGRMLTAARVALVNQHTHGLVLDVGVGSGAFVKGRPDTFGYDVNPAAVQYLQALRRFADPIGAWDAVTFWDSLEHIPDFGPLLELAQRFVFISTPIYPDLPGVLASKHFRPDEHCWYWTRDGLVRHLAHYGFQLVYACDLEERLGREAIGTFVFRRRTAA
jgi:hypothetical protein